MPALLAIAAACTFGVADFLAGLSTRKAAVVAITLITNLAGAALSVVLVVVIDGEWTVRALGWGALGGLAGLVGLVLSTKDSQVDPIDSSARSVLSLPQPSPLSSAPHSVTDLALSRSPVCA